MGDELDSEYTELTLQYLEEVAENKAKYQKRKSRENEAKHQSTGNRIRFCSHLYCILAIMEISIYV